MKTTQVHREMHEYKLMFYRAAQYAGVAGTRQTIHNV